MGKYHTFDQLLSGSPYLLPPEEHQFWPSHAHLAWEKIDESTTSCNGRQFSVGPDAKVVLTPESRLKPGTPLLEGIEQHLSSEQHLYEIGKSDDIPRHTFQEVEVGSIFRLFESTEERVWFKKDECTRALHPYDPDRWVMQTLPEEPIRIISGQTRLKPGTPLYDDLGNVRGYVLKHCPDPHPVNDQLRFEMLLAKLENFREKLSSHGNIPLQPWVMTELDKHIRAAKEFPCADLLQQEPGADVDLIIQAKIGDDPWEELGDLHLEETIENLIIRKAYDVQDYGVLEFRILRVLKRVTAKPVVVSEFRLEETK